MVHEFGIARRPPLVCRREREAFGRSALAQGDGNSVPIAARLDVSRIDAGHWAAQPETPAVRIDPVPDFLILSIGAGHVDGAAVPVTAGRARAAVQRIARVGLEAARDLLAPIVAKRAEHRPEMPAASMALPA